MQNNLAKAIDLYVKYGLQLHILLQTPEQMYDAHFIYPRIYSLPSTVREYTLEKYAISKQDYVQKKQEIISLIEPYVRKNITLFDPTNLTCTTSKCPIGTVDESYYYDKDHLSIIGSKRLIPIFDAMLKKDS